MVISRVTLAFCALTLLFTSACRTVYPFKIVRAGHADDEVPVSTAYRVLVAGNLAYLANGEDGVRIYDISNPALPVNVGHIPKPDSVKQEATALTDGIALSGKSLSLANYQDGLRVYDVSNPSGPISMGGTNDYIYGTNDECIYFSITSSGKYIYAACCVDGVRVYDVSDPAHPLGVGHRQEENSGAGFSAEPAARQLALSGNLACLADGRDGLRIYDVSNPTNLIPLGHVPENTNDDGSAYAVAVSGNHAFVANSNDGLRIYDISNPRKPTNAGHVNDKENYGRAVGVTLAGDYVLLANYFDGVRIYDVSNPSKPVCVGHTEQSIADENGWCADDVALSANFLFIANGHDVLRVCRVIPQIIIDRTKTNTLVSWPVPLATEFVLQEKLNRPSNQWISVTNTPVVISNRCQVSLPPESGKPLFRINYP
jgi:hypothetical protein